MFAKAYRWVAEMEEIAGFTGPEAAGIYQAIGQFYAGVAASTRPGRARPRPAWRPS